MFRIAWKQNTNGQWTRGLSRYSSAEEAQEQVSLFKYLFPDNTYVVEPI